MAVLELHRHNLVLKSACIWADIRFRPDQNAALWRSFLQILLNFRSEHDNARCRAIRQTSGNTIQGGFALGIFVDVSDADDGAVVALGHLDQRGKAFADVGVLVGISSYRLHNGVNHDETDLVIFLQFITEPGQVFLEIE